MRICGLHDADTFLGCSSVIRHSAESGADRVLEKVRQGTRDGPGFQPYAAASCAGALHGRCFRSSSFTICGLAWPRVSFITWPDEEAQHPVAPLPELLGRTRVGGHDAGHDGLQLAGVGDLAQALLGDDAPGALAGGGHGLEHLLGHLAGEGAVAHQTQQLGQSLGAHRRTRPPPARPR